MQDFIKIHKNDNVAVALKPLPKGAVYSVEGNEVAVIEEIPQGHKFALRDIDAGEDVIKYGFRIGTAKEAVKKGGWIHVHNIKTALGELLEYSYHPNGKELDRTKPAYFNGYKRKNGKVGVRNELWIIPTVGCVNSIAAAMAKQAQYLRKGTIEEVVAFPHPYG